MLVVGALVVLTKDVVGGLDGGVAVRGLVGVGGDEAYLFTGKVGAPKKMPANNSGGEVNTVLGNLAQGLVVLGDIAQEGLTCPALNLVEVAIRVRRQLHTCWKDRSSNFRIFSKASSASIWASSSCSTTFRAAREPRRL